VSRDEIIYLDYAATAPLDPRVAERMAECLLADGVFANPSSPHAAGREAARCIASARAQVAGVFSCAPGEIVWTSGATESDNLALMGAARYNRHRGRHIVTSRTEHKAVLDTCAALEQEGFEVSYLVPEADGIVTPAQVEGAIRPDTLLVSLMHVNNEIGVIQDIEAVARLCRERGVLFHVDAAQAAGKLLIDLATCPVDLVSISAHKFYGPKGAGALFVRDKPRCNLAPLLHGGGQERGLRPGTLPTHQIVGLASALTLCAEDMDAEAARIRALRDRLWSGLEALGGVYRNGDPERRVPGILNVSFEGVEGEALLFALHPLAVSSGSACSSARRESSYVLRALGRSDQLAQSSIRFSLGRYTSTADIDRALEITGRAVGGLRRVSGWQCRAPA
jgi:cysteine desulfurase